MMNWLQRATRGKAMKPITPCASAPYSEEAVCEMTLTAPVVDIEIGIEEGRSDAMLEPVKKTHFREIASGRIVEINPAQVRMLRIVDGATEIVFSETHSVVVKASRAAVSGALWGKEPAPLPRPTGNHAISAVAN